MSLEWIKHSPIEQSDDEVPLPSHLVQESGPLPHAPGRLGGTFWAVHQLTNKEDCEQNCCHPNSPVSKVLKLPEVVSFEILGSYKRPLYPHEGKDDASVSKQDPVPYFTS